MHGPLNVKFPFGLSLLGEVGKSSTRHHLSTVNSYSLCVFNNIN